MFIDAEFQQLSVADTSSSIEHSNGTVKLGDAVFDQIKIGRNGVSLSRLVYYPQVVLRTDIGPTLFLLGSELTAAEQAKYQIPDAPWLAHNPPRKLTIISDQNTIDGDQALSQIDMKESHVAIARAGVRRRSNPLCPAGSREVLNVDDNLALVIYTPTGQDHIPIGHLQAVYKPEGYVIEEELLALGQEEI